MNPESVQATVCDLIRQVAPRKITREIVPDDLLGDDGLGLDSIARVELLAEIDIALGVTVPVQVFSDPQLTVRALVSHVVEAAA